MQPTLVFFQFPSLSLPSPPPLPLNSLSQFAIYFTACAFVPHWKMLSRRAHNTYRCPRPKTEDRRPYTQNQILTTSNVSIFNAVSFRLFDYLSTGTDPETDSDPGTAPISVTYAQNELKLHDVGRRDSGKEKGI